MSAEFEWKMVYALIDGEIKTVECYSSFWNTDINWEGIRFIAGENPLNTDLQEIEDSEIEWV